MKSKIIIVIVLLVAATLVLPSLPFGPGQYGIVAALAVQDDGERHASILPKAAKSVAGDLFSFQSESDSGPSALTPSSVVQVDSERPQERRVADKVGFLAPREPRLEDVEPPPEPFNYWAREPEDDETVSEPPEPPEDESPPAEDLDFGREPPPDCEVTSAPPNPWAGVDGWAAEYRYPVETRWRDAKGELIAHSGGKDGPPAGVYMSYRFGSKKNPGQTVLLPVTNSAPAGSQEVPVLVSEPRAPELVLYNQLEEEIGVRAFRTTVGEPRVAIPVGTGVRVFPTMMGRNREGYALVDWLAYERYERVGKSAPVDLLSEVVDVARRLALADSLPLIRVVKLWLRVAPTSDSRGALLDLADGTGRHIEISGDGWGLRSSRVPIFDTRPTMLPLPEPARVRFEDVESILWKHIALQDPDEHLLLLASVLHRLRPGLGQPVDVFVGEQGSRKTSTQRRACSLLDPSTIRDLEIPDDPRELTALVANSLTLPFDNVSFIKPEIADRLCRLATGTSLAARSLYTNHDVSNVEARPKVCINGIDPMPRRGDLLSRTLVFQLLRPTSGEFVPDDVLEKEWETDHGRILGGILDLATRTFHELERGDLPVAGTRLASFAATLSAMLRALGRSPAEAARLLGGNDEARAEVEAADEWVAATLEYVQTLFAPDFIPLLPATADTRGFTARTLSDYLRYVHPNLFMGRNIDPLVAARVVGQRLRRVVPSLRSNGFEVTDGPRTGHVRTFLVSPHTAPGEPKDPKEGP